MEQTAPTADKSTTHAEQSDPPLGDNPPSSTVQPDVNQAADATPHPDGAPDSPPSSCDEPWHLDAPNESDIASDNASRSEDDTGPLAGTINIVFVDFAFTPIEGLQYKLKVGGNSVKGATDAAGKAATLTDILPGSEVEIFVGREHTKDYKQIGSFYAHSGLTGYTIVSPKIKFEVETEPHVGPPGDAEESRPPPVPALEESAPPASAKPAVSAPAPAPASPASKSPVAPPKPPASQSTGAGNSATASKAAIVPGRDARGHPQATVQDSTVDWLKRKLLFVFNLWNWTSSQTPAKPEKSHGTSTLPSPATASTAKRKDQAAAPTTTPSQGHPKINPLSQPAELLPGGQLSDADLARLHALIDFAEKQVKLDYSPYRGAGGTTANVLKEYAKTAAPSFSEKPPGTPKGLCQVYVKVALFKAGYTAGPGAEGQAKTSGRDWMHYGFTDISNNLPQVEITYEDAMADKDMPRVQQVFRKKAELAKMQADRKKQKNPMTAEEIAAFEKEIPPMPQKTVAKYTQPDLMYTLPGDVIVYEQVDPLEFDAAGHVDIRTYHGFVSDFAWLLIPSLGKSPSRKKRYRVTGIYRKISDSIATHHVQAFLRILRELETTGYSEPYRALPRKDKKAVSFEGFESHPGQQGNLPAGAYQIKWETWDEVISITGWPRTFTPEMQDRIAIYKLQSRNDSQSNPVRTALGYIMEGKVEDAVCQAKLWKEWACLPGGAKQARISMTELKERFQKYVEEYKK